LASRFVCANKQARAIVSTSQRNMRDVVDAHGQATFLSGAVFAFAALALPSGGYRAGFAGSPRT